MSGGESVLSSKKIDISLKKGARRGDKNFPSNREEAGGSWEISQHHLAGGACFSKGDQKERVKKGETGRLFLLGGGGAYKKEGHNRGA